MLNFIILGFLGSLITNTMSKIRSPAPGASNDRESTSPTRFLHYFSKKYAKNRLWGVFKVADYEYEVQKYYTYTWGSCRPGADVFYGDFSKIFELSALKFVCWGFLRSLIINMMLKNTTPIPGAFADLVPTSSTGIFQRFFN